MQKSLSQRVEQGSTLLAALSSQNNNWKPAKLKQISDQYPFQSLMRYLILHEQLIISQQQNLQKLTDIAKKIDNLALPKTLQNDKLQRDSMIKLSAAVIVTSIKARSQLDCQIYCDKILRLTDNIPTLKQATYLIFGVKSLALIKYQQCNEDFLKLTPQKQQMMAYSVFGKVRWVAGRQIEAGSYFQKALTKSNQQMFKNKHLFKAQISAWQRQSQINSSIGLLKYIIGEFLRKQEELILKQKGSTQQRFQSQFTAEQKYKLNNYLKVHYDIDLNSLKQNEVQKKLNALTGRDKNIAFLILKVLKETNPLVIKRIKTETFIKKVLAMKQAHNNGILSKINGGSKINSNTTKSDKPSAKFIEYQHKTDKYEKEINFCMVGEFEIKCNSGNGKINERYIKAYETCLKWSSEEEKIDGGTQCDYLDVYGIVYGKVTPVMTTPDKNKMEPYRCLSILTRDRSYDFYCPINEERKDDTIPWILGLGHHVNKCRSRIVLQIKTALQQNGLKQKQKEKLELKLRKNEIRYKNTKGKLLWKRLFMIIEVKAGDKVNRTNNNFFSSKALTITKLGQVYKSAKKISTIM